jgi:hypothetical protein
MTDANEGDVETSTNAFPRESPESMWAMTSTRVVVAETFVSVAVGLLPTVKND